MCHEFEGWVGQRRSARPERREQTPPPVRQQPVVPPVAPAPVVRVFEPAPRFTQREKQPA